MAQASDAAVANAVDAVKATKDPPPETWANKQTRWLVIAAFWAAAVLFGLPVWWRTTTVYRADLPRQLMTDWAEGKICSPEVPLLVKLDTSSLDPEDGLPIVAAIREAYARISDEGSMHSVEFTSHTDTELDRLGKPTAVTVKVESWIEAFWEFKDDSRRFAWFRRHSNVIDILFSPSMISESNFTSSIGTFVAETLLAMVDEEDAVLAHLKSPSTPATAITRLSTDVAESVARRPTRAFKSAATYHLAFSLFTPEAWPYAWEVEKGLQEIFGPLLAALSPVSNFTVETQVQPYAALSPSLQPVYDEQLKAWTIPREELGGFINAAEWPLSPSIGSGPTIHFVLYVASASASPLVVEGSNSNSWLVPQWGGIAIYNPKLKRGGVNPTSLSSSDLKPALLTFSNHLLSLLGVPSTPPESFHFRVASLVRIRAVSLFLSASSTLGSIASVVSQLPSISIPDSVARNVSAALTHLELACSDLKMGRFDDALMNAREADAQAERAFFEKSMVGQVYFPDEHKVAVYLPLLGPIAVPLLVSALKEIRQWMRTRNG